MNLPRSADGLARALKELGIDVRFNLRAMHHEFRANGNWLQANDRTSRPAFKSASRAHLRLVRKRSTDLRSGYLASGPQRAPGRPRNRPVPGVARRTPGLGWPAAPRQLAG